MGEPKEAGNGRSLLNLLAGKYWKHITMYISNYQLCRHQPMNRLPLPDFRSFLVTVKPPSMLRFGLSVWMVTHSIQMFSPW